MTKLVSLEKNEEKDICSFLRTDSMIVD